jgi:hypothetical protein
VYGLAKLQKEEILNQREASRNLVKVYEMKNSLKVSPKTRKLHKSRQHKKP